MPDRREVIKTAFGGVAAAALLSVVPTQVFASKNQIAGWKADGLSKPVLETARSWAVEAGNPILAHQFTQADIHQAALAYRLVNEHLDSLDFHRAAAQHLSLHHDLLTYNDAAVERQFAAIQAAGLNLDRSRHTEFVKMAYDHPKVVRAVARYVHTHGAGNFHKLLVQQMRHQAQFSPTDFTGQARFKRMQDDGWGTWDYSGDFGDFIWDAEPTVGGSNYFTERQCFYADAAIEYIAIVGLAAPGVGEAVAIPLVVAWAITKLGGC